MSTEKSRTKYQKLKQLLAREGGVLIFMQDYPDPDAIAAASALRHIVRNTSKNTCTLTHGGRMGRAENRALVRYAGLKLRKVEEIDVSRFAIVALVDTQVGTGNNSFPEQKHKPQIIIDHHPFRAASKQAEFTDVRKRYGATSTILYEYLQAGSLAIDTKLATTLTYGIRSDTQDLGREATKADIDAYLALYPLANKRMLSKIENAALPRNYFRIISDAILDATSYGQGIIAGLGELEYPDALGEIADLLLRNEDSSVVLCYGVQDEKVLLSMRTSASGLNAGRLMEYIVGKEGTGGGHTSLAGGQIPLKKNTTEEYNAIVNKVCKRFRTTAGCRNKDGYPLVERASSQEI